MLRYECRAPSAPQTEPTAVDYLLIMPGYVYFLKITFIGENSTLNDEARRSFFFGTEKKEHKSQGGVTNSGNFEMIGSRRG